MHIGGKWNVSEEERAEILQKCDGLSDRAKSWLHHAAECMDEGVEYINDSPSRKECRLAGLITQKPFGRIEIEAEVMQIVYVEGYLAKARK